MALWDEMACVWEARAWFIGPERPGEEVYSVLVSVQWEASGQRQTWVSFFGISCPLCYEIEL